MIPCYHWNNREDLSNPTQHESSVKVHISILQPLLNTIYVNKYFVLQSKENPNLASDYEAAFLHILSYWSLPDFP